MINEEKITEAAIQNADKYNPCRSTLDREEVCRASFVNGVKWFKEAIWHDASEKPQGSAAILYLWHDEQGGMDVGIDGVFDDLEWKKFVEYNKITKWCYINDILAVTTIEIS